jgi:hypothetical protein
MIKFMAIDTKTCPIISCEYCGDMISDHREGIALSPYFDPKTSNLKKGECVHLHSPKCLDLYLQKVGKKVSDFDTQALAIHLYYLITNTDMDPALIQKLSQQKGTV